MSLKQINYDDARLEYFKAEYAHLERRLNYWASDKRINDNNWNVIDDTCKEIGMHMSFIEDAIWALEATRNGRPRMGSILR